MPITYIFGNGLSVAYQPDFYGLTALTTTVQTELGLRTLGAQTLLEVTDSLVDRMRQGGPIHGVRSFEEYAGPLERLAASISQLGNLGVAAENAAEAAAIKNVAERARTLYVRVVAVVLDIVTRHVNKMGDATPIQAVAEHLIEAAKANDEAHVFTLNYDALLDSALLHFYSDDEGRPRDNSGFLLVDDAQGNLGRTIQINGQDVRALGFREDLYGGKVTVRLYHLHGAATWIRVRSTGEVVKVRHLQDLRDRDLWKRWADGLESDIEPVVVLGDRKDRLITRSPFDQQYGYLQSSVTASEDVVIAGYGFGDSPLNRAVRAALHSGSRVWVINPDPAVENIARNELNATGGRAGSLTFIAAGLPEGLIAFTGNR